MNRRSWKICCLIVLIGTLTALIRLSYGLGFLAGSLIGILLYLRNERYWNEVVDGGSVGKSTGLLHFSLNYLLMASVMLVGVKYPQYVNIFTGAAGLMIIKLTVLADSLLTRKE